MKLLIGLGNPGKKYEKTRHNIGFLFVEYIQEKNSFSDWKEEKKFEGRISEGTINGEKYILLEPQTFMNLSGKSIQKVIHFYKLSLFDCIVVYDDVSMDFGKIRLRESGSAGGHNGMKSIIEHLGGNFPRLKIGVGNNPVFDLSDWVLSNFSPLEFSELKDIFIESETILLKNFQEKQ